MQIGVMLVFNTVYEDLRYMTSSIVHNNKTDIIQAIIDTGAKKTCFMASSFKEIELKEGNFDINDSIRIKGLVTKDQKDNEVSCIYYRYKVKQITIGNIDLNQQDIWVTFDDRVTDNVLGLDLLCRIGMIQLPNQSNLAIFRDKNELYKFIIENVQDLNELGIINDYITRKTAELYRNYYC